MITKDTRGEFPWRRLAPLFAIGLLFRSALALIPADRNVGDQSQYLDLAKNLRAYATFGHGDAPAVHRAPLYPMILAVFGNAGTLALQMIAGTLIAPLTFVLAAETLPPMGAMAAGLAMALAPMSSRYCTLFMTETLFTFLLVLGAFSDNPQTRDQRNLLRLSGPHAGRPLAVLDRSSVSRVQAGVAIDAARPASALAVVAPWTLRNAVETHRFVPIATAGWGSNLFQGTLDTLSGILAVYHATARRRHGRTLLRRGIERIRQNPLRWLAVRVKQYPRLYLGDGEYVGAWPTHLFWAGDIALVILAAIGCWRTRPGPQIWIYAAFTAVAQLPMWTEARYSLPMVPFLLILAGGSLFGAGSIPPPRISAGRP